MNDTQIDTLLRELAEILARNGERYQRGEPFAEEERRDEIVRSLEIASKERKAAMTNDERIAMLARVKALLASLEEP